MFDDFLGVEELLCKIQLLSLLDLSKNLWFVLIVIMLSLNVLERQKSFLQVGLLDTWFPVSFLNRVIRNSLISLRSPFGDLPVVMNILEDDSAVLSLELLRLIFFLKFDGFLDSSASGKFKFKRESILSRRIAKFPGRFFSSSLRSLTNCLSLERRVFSISKSLVWSNIFFLDEYVLLFLHNPGGLSHHFVVDIELTNVLIVVCLPRLIMADGQTVPRCLVHVDCVSRLQYFGFELRSGIRS